MREAAENMKASSRPQTTWRYLCRDHLAKSKMQAFSCELVSDKSAKVHCEKAPARAGKMSTADLNEKFCINKGVSILFQGFRKCSPKSGSLACQSQAPFFTDSHPCLPLWDAKSTRNLGRRLGGGEDALNLQGSTLANRDAPVQHKVRRQVR